MCPGETPGSAGSPCQIQGWEIPFKQLHPAVLTDLPAARDEPHSGDSVGFSDSRKMGCASAEHFHNLCSAELMAFFVTSNKAELALL